MKRTFVVLTILLMVVLLHSKFTVIEETSDYLLLEFVLGDYSLEDLGEFTFFRAPGVDHSNEVGAPMLPHFMTYIGIPDNGYLDFQIIEQQRSDHRLSKPLLPAPRIIPGEEVSEYIYSMDEAKYRLRSESLIQAGERTHFRYNSIIPVTINPVAYNYETGQLTITERLLFGIRISGNTAQRSQPVDDLDLDFNILNYNTAKHWQEKNLLDINYAPFELSDFWYSFEVAEDGLHELTYQQLAALPLNDIDPRSIRIFSTGGKLLPNLLSNTGYPFSEIPLLIEGEENGQFDPDDRIIFYGQKRDGFEQNEYLSSTVNHYYNPYSGRTVYWLTFGGNFPEPPKRITELDLSQPEITRTTAPAFYHYETESVRRDQEGFTWYTALLSNTVDTNHNYSFAVPYVDTTQEQSVTIAVRSGESVSRSLSINVNGNLVINRQSWSGTAYRTFQRSANFLQEGNNNLILSIHRTENSSVYLDYFTVRYQRFLTKGNNQLLFPINDQDFNRVVQYNLNGNSQSLRAFQINSFDQISQLSVETLPAGSGYSFAIRGQGLAKTQYATVRDGEYFNVFNFREVFPTDLTVQNQPVDALIITPEIFRNYAELLAQHYWNGEGIRALVIDQQDIFNQFNSGMPDPNAIRLFIRHAFYNYPTDNGLTTLKNVTLVGSGTIDWRNFSGLAAEKNKLILFHRVEETSEDFFVDQTGNGKPDLGIGRIPIQNSVQGEIVFNKLSQAWSNPTPGLWNNTLLFLADDEYKGLNMTEIGHSRDIQDLSQMISPGVIIDKIFAFDYPFDPFQNKPQARDSIVSSLNEGRLIWLYVGHGAPQMLGDENYFRLTDIQLLNNQSKQPLFIAASCSVAKYDYFGLNSLSESLLWHPAGGTIASLAATNLTSPLPNWVLTRNFLPRIINQYISPGIALMQAKNAASEAQHKYYTYLGDPVLPIVTPQRSENIVIQDDPDSLFAYQRVELQGSLSAANSSGLVDVIAYSSETDLNYTGQEGQLDFDYSKWGRIYFKGQSSLNSGQYEASFLVPGDILPGERGRVISYYYDHVTKQDYVDFYYPKRLTNIPYAGAVQDTIPPEVTIWLDSPNFRNGDMVSQNPMLYARIEDESGINILGELGHKILLLLDNETLPIDVTSGFIYDVDSYQAGTLSWQLRDLSEGEHQLRLIVFDNFNNPSVSNVHFYIRITDRVVIDKLLPYPNPIRNDGHFTFILSDDAQITITIYTITGRRIRTLNAQGAKGYNQIYWDGRDQENSRLANNTYLYKVRAKEPITGKVTEELGKVIILR